MTRAPTDAPAVPTDEPEDLLRGLLEGIQAGLAVVNTDLRILYGGGPGKAPGPAHGACYEALFERDSPCSVCHAREVFESGETRRAVTEVPRGDGSSAWFEVLAFPLRGPEGDVRHVIEMTRDVTRERELEAELRRSEKLAAVGRLAAGIAHEVKNPLGIIQSAVDVVANPDRPEDQRTEAADLLRAEVHRLSTLVTDFLTYARPRPLDPRHHDLGEILRRTVGDFSQGREAERVPELEIEEDLPERSVDADLIRQVLLNLLLNADEAAGPAGRIRLRARAVEDRVEIAVEDDGPGIPGEARGRIFEPFFTTRARGSGLGLAIVRQIVVAHGGRVDVDDRRGGGTVFRVTL
jgi:two-component system sensor histidine kinase HydH